MTDIFSLLEADKFIKHANISAAKDAGKVLVIIIILFLITIIIIVIVIVVFSASICHVGVQEQLSNEN